MIRVPIVSQMRHLRGIAVALCCALSLLTVDAAMHPVSATVEQARLLLQRMAAAQRELQGYPQIMELWRQSIPQFYCKPPQKPNRAEDLRQLKQWEDRATKLAQDLARWRTSLRRLASNQFVLNTIVADAGHNPDSTDFWQPYQNTIRNARTALAGAKNDVNSRPERDCSPPEEEQEPQTESPPPPDPLAGVYQPTYREVPDVSVPDGPVCEDEYWEILQRVGQARADAAFNAWQAQLVVWSIANKGLAETQREKYNEARAEVRRRDKVYDDLDALYKKAKALETIDCTEQEPPETQTETGVPGDLGVDIPEPAFVPVNMPDIPEGPLCKEDKQKIVNAAYIQRNNALTNQGRAQSWLSAIRSALMSGRGNRAALIHARGRAVTTVRERKNAFRAADAAYKKAQAISIKPCDEDVDETATGIGTDAAGACGTAAAAQQANAGESRSNAAQNSADYSWSGSVRYQIGYGLSLEVPYGRDLWDDATDVADEAVKDGAKQAENCPDPSTDGQTDITVPNTYLPIDKYHYLFWGRDLNRSWLDSRIGARFGVGTNYYQSNGQTQGSVDVPQSAGSAQDVESFLDGLQSDGRIDGFGQNYCREWFQRRSDDRRAPIGTSVGSEQLESLPLNLRSISGIIESTPGVGIGNATVSIRGADPHWSAGIDGVWNSTDALGPAVTTTNDLGQYYFDAEALSRVEVLRGPQGTLFGRSATGGVVNAVTQSGTQGFGTLLAGYDWSSVALPLTNNLLGRTAVGESGKVPVLSGIPFTGELFREFDDGSGRDPDLIFWVTPDISRAFEYYEE